VVWMALMQCACAANISPSLSLSLSNTLTPTNTYPPSCIVDGFLVGSTSAISPQAGIVLGVANMIEMGFLGLAVSVRVNKCTGSSAMARYTSLVMPPLIMFFAAVIGSLSGSAARAHPVVFISFISFAIVALLFLVVNELLVEAREAQAGKEYWWSAMVLFGGIYSVILIDMIV
jgi:zinc transporter ZupT